MNESVEKLLQLINTSLNSKEVKLAKLRLLRKLMDESKENLTERIQRSSDETEIETAKWVLWQMNMDKSFEGLMKIVGSSSDEMKIREAAIVMGEQGYQEAVEPLIKLLLTTTSEQVRSGAALGLRDLADQRSLKPIVEMIEMYSDDCGTLVYALETLDCREIVEFLVDVFISHPKDIMLRQSICECIRNTELVNLPEEVIENCKNKIRESIYTIGDEENIEQLELLYELFK